jgi:hypothetical protein
VLKRFQAGWAGDISCWLDFEVQERVFVIFFTTVLATTHLKTSLPVASTTRAEKRHTHIHTHTHIESGTSREH